MTNSSNIQRFVNCIPRSGLFTDKLNELAKEADRLASIEPELVAQFSLIRDAFFALATSWEDQPISPAVSGEITPPIIAAVQRALVEPSLSTLSDLAKTLNRARDYPLLSGVEGDSIPEPFFPGGTPRL